jgi:hypothetical protein
MNYLIVPLYLKIYISMCLRYVGDMLAWIHQSIASERELLQTLLKLCSAEG